MVAVRLTRGHILTPDPSPDNSPGPDSSLDPDPGPNP